MEWNRNFGMEYGRYQNGMEWKISGMEWKAIFHASTPIPYSILHMTFAEKYIRIVITKNMWKRLAANYLPQINRVVWSLALRKQCRHCIIRS